MFELIGYSLKIIFFILKIIFFMLKINFSIKHCMLVTLFSYFIHKERTLNVRNKKNKHIGKHKVLKIQ